jgi:hypothetical protein
MRMHRKNDVPTARAVSINRAVQKADRKVS